MISVGMIALMRLKEEQMNKNKKSVEYPYMNGYCEKCENHYLLDGDESRCNVITLLGSSAMCAQVTSCVKYKERKQEGGIK